MDDNFKDHLDTNVWMIVDEGCEPVCHNCGKSIDGGHIVMRKIVNEEESINYHTTCAPVGDNYEVRWVWVDYENDIPF